MKSLVNDPAHVQNETFLISSPFVSNGKEFSIENEQYDEILNSINFLRRYMKFEEGILLIKFAYSEFEKFLLNISVDEYVFPDIEFVAFQNMRLLANLRTSSYLNSVSSFKDHFPELSNFHLCDYSKKNFSSDWDKARRSSVSFNFCERLRNYSQHQEPPVDFVTTGGGWNSDRTLLETHASIFVTVEDVCRNRSISTSEKKAYVEEFGEKADIALLVREYTGKIGEISKDVRNATQKQFEFSSEIYIRALETIQGRIDGKGYGELVRFTNGEVSEKTTIFPDFLNRAKQLRNGYISTNNRSHFISSKARGHSGSRT